MIDLTHMNGREKNRGAAVTNQVSVLTSFKIRRSVAKQQSFADVQQ